MSVAIAPLVPDAPDAARDAAPTVAGRGAQEPGRRRRRVPRLRPRTCHTQ